MQSVYKIQNREQFSIIANCYLGSFFFYTTCIILVLFQSGCKKLVNVDPPVTNVTGVSVYNSDVTATAVLTGLYSQMSQTNNGFTASIPNISFWAGLSADEFILWSGGSANQKAYFKNALSINTGGFEFWNNVYPFIFTCNSTIEGLSASTALTPTVKQQLLGEAKFMRAFFYFYLVNLYGNVPQVLTTDYTVNASLPRTPKEQIYQKIISDLKDAQDLLTDGYVKADAITVYPVASAERVRPNKSAVTALLARVYLYAGDYVNAEAQATNVINNSTYYSLTTLNNVFLKNSKEAIWQLQPVTSGAITNTADAVTFIMLTEPSSTYPVQLSNNLLNSFEPGDQRNVNGNWVNSITVQGTTYYYAYKYKVNGNGDPVSEYTMILRLGEQYLIRAEARAQQGNISGAQSDLNAIRSRAWLGSTTANDKPSLLTAILNERQVELFTELGHRWLDLKRTGTIDAVMNVVTPLKGGTWNTNWQLYPIPLTDLQRNLNLTQNTGY